MSVPLPIPAEYAEPGDAELIESVRSGDSEAYGVLYRRHARSALALARQLTGSRTEADDLVAESFAKVLDMLRGGGGPDAAFRAYLLTTLRHTLYDRARRDRKLELSDDMTRYDPGVSWEDTAVADLESALAARAFHRLPERWQTVLWHTEVEQESPAEVAPLLGLTPNGVAALAYRAREGLRQAYLQEHLANGVDGAHRATVNRLGAWARGGLSARHRARVDAHLAVCGECRALAAELVDVNGGLRGVVAPLVLGTAAAAYLAHVTGGAAGVTSAAAATASAGGALSNAAAGTGAAAGGSAGAGSAAAGSAAASGTAGSAAAGGSAGAGSAGAGSAGAGSAAAGSAAAGSAAAGGAAAGGAAGSAGSTLGSVASWVVGTHVGQAAAAAVAAVVIGGTTVVATHDGVGLTRGTPPAAADESDSGGASASPGSGGRASAPAAGNSPTGGPSGTAGPGAGPSPDPGGGTSGVPGGGDPRPTDRPTGTGAPSAAPGGGTGGPGTTPGAGAPQNLLVDPIQPIDAMRTGAPGEVALTVRNTGGDADNLRAIVRLPVGFRVDAGSGGNGWDCTPAGRVANCSRAELAADASTTLRVQLTAGGSGGSLTGTVTSAGRPTTQIAPATMLVTP